MSDDRTAKLAETNFWAELLALRDRQRAERKDGMQVLKRRELPLEANRQGLMRWYMHPEIKDTVLSTYLCFEQEIPPGSRSGRLKFQGGQVIYVIAGRGYTLLDGVKHPWAAGDVINLPLRRGGIVVQHFNDDPNEPAHFLAVEPNLFACTSVDRGSGFEQIEDAPEFPPETGMTERERTREREPGEERTYDKMLAFYRERVERNAMGPVVIRKDDREVELSRQGRIRYYLNHEKYKDSPLQQWLVFSHELRTASGKHKHQGGLVIYVIEGRGYSMVDGERWEWEAGDLMLLPLRPEGVEHQHFNLDPEKPSTWIAFINTPISEHLAHEMTQMQDSPEFRG